MNSTWEHVASGETTLKNMMLEKLRPLYATANEQERQERLRERYPALQAAYDNYLMVLRMVENEIETEETTELA